MLINELPDDCLMAIFEYVNDLDDLINCYKVCVRWTYLITERTKKAKYLQGKIQDPHQTYVYEKHRWYDDSDYSDPFRYPINHVFYQGGNPIDVTCLNTLFPNLKVSLYYYSNFFLDIVSFFGNLESLKGIIAESGNPFAENCDKLEMVSAFASELSKIRNCSRIKQLYTGDFSLNAVKRYAHDFPNLELLRTSILTKGSYHMSQVPVFEKLKILTLSTENEEEIFDGFHFMDSCPNLQSAHITMEFNRFFVDETSKLECLQDLVIIFKDDKRINRNDLIRLLMKYPNLKHLALRGARNLKDEHIKQLIHILPNLVLFDVRGCPSVTRKAAYYIQDYCKRYGRSIKFYFIRNRHEIESDWPQLSTKNEKISRGFDFMKHYFLKDNFELPHFLIPIDY
uniref:F-box domain-containing protein n=1 Tax=Tetranychus urticae TaxID=32264 RepID=T1K8Q9_TETUR